MTKPQYAFPLEFPADYAAENFLVSEANRHAFRLVSAWPEWPARAVLLHGPAQSGKTHLAHIWRTKTEARLIRAADLYDFTTVACRYAVVEDIENIASEAALAHLYNHVNETGGGLLLTARTPPGRLPFALPDLRSRLGAALAVSIGMPDDGLLEALLVKQFSDRQLRVGEGVIAYLLRRLERSYVALQCAVEAIDHAAMAQGRTVTVSLARDMLEAA